MSNITPFLWFDGKAEEAMNFYTSIFKNSKVGEVSRYGEGAPFPKGSVMSATFVLDGQQFYALNGGPGFPCSPAVSFFINAETQEEIDRLWEKLSEGGEKQQCGWVKDQFGFFWQVVPPILKKYLNDSDPEKSRRVMMAMMQMTKLDIQKLQDAYDGK